MMIFFEFEINIKGSKKMAKISHPEKLQGKYVRLREVAVDDASFILSLRNNENKNKFLHKTDNSLNSQIEYIKKYLTLENEWYFVSENLKGEKIGVIRIYDLKEDSFCFGSWIMIDGVSLQEVFETDYLTRMYGFDVLGFHKNHFDVRKGNEKVWKYHEFLGAKRVGETELDYLYEVTKDDYVKKADLMWKLAKTK